MIRKKRILIIEDDPNIIQLAKIHLEDLEFVLESAVDGLQGVKKFQEFKYDLVILDLMLPHLDGFEVCKKIRSENKFIPILILSAKSEELEKVLGLELGADDYLTKPFSIRELIARIKAIFRRIEIDQEDEFPTSGSYDFGDLKIFPEKRKVTLKNKLIELTAKEYDLLLLFSKRPGRTFSRQELLDLVWGYHFEGYDHTVNSHINRLRSKIEKDPANPIFIKTIWGVGYRFIEREEIEG